MKEQDYLLHQGIKKWNFFFTLIFVIVGTLFYITLLRLDKLPQSISVFDFIILSLTTFRVIRLFVYDNIFLFMREVFMDSTITVVDGEEQYSFTESMSALKRTLHKLALCPWCIGVWASLCSLFVFYLIPESYILFLIFAVAGLASLFQISSNMIGWQAEHLKKMTEKITHEK